MPENALQELRRAIDRRGQYPAEAYEFVHAGLVHTVNSFARDKEPGESRHVTGRELCLGLLDLAQRRWGLLAPIVLRAWNIRQTRDFGEIVFHLIDLGVMSRQESDRLEDFVAVYDFTQAFDAYTIDAAPDVRVSPAI